MTKTCIEIECFHPLDRITAEAIVQEQDSPLFFLFCYVSAAFRAGHLFVRFDSKKIYPEPHTIIETEDHLAIDHLAIQEMLFDAISLLQDSVHPMYVYADNRLYLRRAYEVSTSIENEYKRLELAQCRWAFSADKAKQFLEDAVLEKKLLQSQAQAIFHALQKPIATISGGPGTGKTYTAGMLLKTLFSCSVSQTPSRIALCAPTAKATQQLQKSIEAFCGTSDFIDAKTIHSLVELKPFGYRRGVERMLAYDLVLVDESSMIDAFLFEKLIRRLPAGTRLILLGDPDQLPPIEPGACFSDSIANDKSRDTKLTQCMRVELEGIISFAKSIRDGDLERVLEVAAMHDSGVVLSFISEGDFESYIDTHIKSYKEIFTSKDPKNLFAEFSKIRVLSSMRSGKLGVDALNSMIQKKVGARARALPIIVCQNDYELALANGQIGMIVGDTAYFETTDGVRRIPRVLLRSYEEAWALSVHKSQGSEFDEVVVFLPQGSERFGRKLLYTAVTRAKKKIHLYTSYDVFCACIKESGF